MPGPAHVTGPRLLVEEDGTALGRVSTIDFSTGITATILGTEATVTVTPAGIGAVTNASNVNLNGIGVFDVKVGTVLNFLGIKSESTALTAALDAGNKTVDLTLDPDLQAIADLSTFPGFAKRTAANTWSTADPHCARGPLCTSPIRDRVGGELPPIRQGLDSVSWLNHLDAYGVAARSRLQ